MNKLDLKEHEKCEAIHLSGSQRDELLGINILAVEPVPGTENRYNLTPGSTIGAFEIGGLSITIRPKLPIPRVLFLASFAMGGIRFLEDLFDFEDVPDLVEVLAPALVFAAQRAFVGGLLHGYQTREEALYTVRGRLHIGKQVRKRFLLPVPIEVRYDDFTEDVLANRLIRAAAARLSHLRIHPQSRTALARIDARLENVSLEEFPPNAVPEVAFDRLNEHYREVVTIARLILRHAAIEAGRGTVRTKGFLMNMEEVFQEFVTRGLQEELGLSERTFRSDRAISRLFLDEGRQVSLKPDFSWWDGGRCRFVGDAKYKRIQDERIPNADLYQLLAYATALDLPGGMLVYAGGEAEEVVHQVRHAGKRLEVAALDLSGTIGDLQGGIRKLAQRIRALRCEVPSVRSRPRDMVR